MRKIVLPEQEIIHLYKDCNKKTSEIAKKYNVSRNVIQRCLTRHNVHKNATYMCFPTLTDRQLEIVNGSLLSDGSLAFGQTAHGNALFIVSQSKYPVGKPTRVPFISWIFKELSPYSKSIFNGNSNERFIRLGDKVRATKSIGMRTCRHTEFTILSKKWYKRIQNRNFKVVPVDLKLTPLALALWVMGDGANIPQCRRITLSTDGFNSSCREQLVKCLYDDLGLCAAINSVGRINICGDDDYLKTISLIEPHIFKESFAYKCSLDGYVKPIFVPTIHGNRISKTEEEIDYLFDTWYFGKDVNTIIAGFRQKFGKTTDRHTVSKILRGKVKTHREDIINVDLRSLRGRRE
jgi:hypothetical protein